MKKILLTLPILFTANLAIAAGGPIPGVNVSLEQIPGGIYHSVHDCTKKGGAIVHKNGSTYCHPSATIIKNGGKIVIPSETDSPPPPPADSTYTKIRIIKP